MFPNSQTNSSTQVLVPISYEFTYVTQPQETLITPVNGTATDNGAPASSGNMTSSLQIKRGSSQTTDKFGNLITETSSPLTTTTSVTASIERKQHQQHQQLAITPHDDRMTTILNSSQNDDLEEEEVEIIIDLNGTKTTKEEEEEDGETEDFVLPKVEEEILRNIIMHLIPTTKKTYVDDILDGVRFLLSPIYFIFLIVAELQIVFSFYEKLSISHEISGIQRNFHKFT